MELKQACKEEHNLNHMTEDALQRLADADGLGAGTQAAIAGCPARGAGGTAICLQPSRGKAVWMVA